MAIESNSDRLMSDINVTPFVDVMLVLLIIFMVSAPMMTQGVDVALPEAVSKALPSDAEQLMVTVDAQNTIFINDYEVSLDSLQEKLIKILDGSHDRQVYFRADKDIAYGMAVRVMSEIKGAGVEKLGMVTEPLGTNRDTSGKKAAASPTDTDRMSRTGIKPDAKRKNAASKDRV
ncbi:ExbD/TolR family protein [Desulfococcus multivorans]|uniref:Biopolymer transport protein ExbD/TolR n=1 Tax=Desulfococcus multivorans DSM 2059 TaxID=1121405 RepID=S7V5W0_DESML|nr:biopolymer transporter ExbD [Desulfococcus multivorans]AOY59481.1 TolR: biopolymer transport protein [Desulfococcus multivorans]AQV01681.1 biopolymer transporter ExbD [Desulfococcus multivorans]EPR40008.1 Biopolymer transport protein ExbD/TolR [Desulfococcus multivorans DSM 2059]SKA01472.1 Cell division and transport-associated protein TolR [Desulfococcus multivorans DSM 2059]